MIISSQAQYVIKNNGDIIKKFTSRNEAEQNLLLLKSNQPLYEAAYVAVVDERGLEMICG